MLDLHITVKVRFRSSTPPAASPNERPLTHDLLPIAPVPLRVVSVLPNLEASRPKDRCPSTSTLACCEEPKLGTTWQGWGTREHGHPGTSTHIGRLFMEK